MLTLKTSRVHKFYMAAYLKYIVVRKRLIPLKIYRAGKKFYYTNWLRARVTRFYKILYSKNICCKAKRSNSGKVVGAKKNNNMVLLCKELNVQKNHALKLCVSPRKHI